jgi:hypothetical protein
MTWRTLAHESVLGLVRSGDQADGKAAETDEQRDTALEEHQVTVAQTAKRPSRLGTPSPFEPTPIQRLGDQSSLLRPTSR